MLEDRRLLAAGDLDALFGSGGIVSTPIGVAADSGQSVSIQVDGKIVVVGSSHNGSNNDFAVVRYDADGSLDATFDGDGKVTTPIDAGPDGATGVAIQSDGKIVVVGYSNNRSNNDFAVARYNTDGSLDTSFDGDGVVTTAIGSSTDEARSVVIQTDGKIVVAGWSHNGADADFALVRYLSDGSLDTSFDSDGIATTDFDTSVDEANSVAIQADGKIVAGGVSRGSDRDFAVVRYQTDGSLDTSFGANGRVATAIGAGDDYGQSVGMQSDGKIVLAGFYDNGSNFDFAVTRYNVDGTPDTSFDTDGMVTTAVGAGYDYGRSVAIQDDGKILVAGESSAKFGVVRYDADGSLDASFGGDGMMTTSIGLISYGYSVALQSDGKIIVAGEASSGADFDFAVVRYLGDPLETLEATLVGGALTVADIHPTGKSNDLTIAVVNSGADLEITDATQHFVAAPVGGTLSNDDRTLTIPLALITTSVSIQAGAGDDIINIGSLGGTFPVDFAVDGQAGADTLNFNGGLTLNGSFFASAEMTDGTDITTNGGGVSITSNSLVYAYDIHSGGGDITFNIDGDLDLQCSYDTAGGDFTVAADGFTMSAGINTGTGTTTLRPFTAGNAISLGGDDAAGVLGISAAELDLIFSDTIIIGGEDAGNISVVDAIIPAGTMSLHLHSGGTVTDSVTGSIMVSNLAVTAGSLIQFNAGSFGNPASSDVDTLALSTAGGEIRFRDLDDLAIGSAAGVTGISSASGNVSIYAAGLLAANAEIEAQSGFVGLYNWADEAFVSVNAPISASSSVVLQADKIDVGATVTSVTNNIVLLPDQTGDERDSILLGALGDSTPNTLELSLAELEFLFAGYLTIGNNSDNSTGTITIDGAIAPTHITSDIYLANKGATSGIAFTANGSISAPNYVSFATPSTITTDSSNVDVTSGTVHFSSPKAEVGSSANPFRIAADRVTMINSFGANLYLHEEDSVDVGSTGLAGGNSTVHLLNGTFRLTANNKISDTNAIVVDGATFDIGSFSDTVGGVTLVSGAITGSGGTVTSTSDFELREGTVSAQLAGSVGLVKQTTGTVTLSGANSYTGVTTVSNGILEITHQNALGDILAGTTVADGATLQVATPSYVSFYEPLTASGFGYADSGALRTLKEAGLNGTIDLAAATKFVQADQGIGIGGAIDNHGFDLTYDQSAISTHSGNITGVISGAGGFIKIGDQQLNLSAANTYSGVTTVNAGILGVSNNGRLGDVTGDTVVNDGGTLSIGPTSYSFTEAITLEGNGAPAYNSGVLFGQNNTLIEGPITLGSDARIAIYNTNSTMTISGPIDDGGNGYGIFVNGFSEPGRTLVLSGANTYTGATMVSSGRLLVNGSLADGPAAVDVIVASNAILGGDGAIGGAVSVSSGGHLASGNSPGILTTGDVTLVSGATFDVEISGPAPGAAGHDQLDVMGTVTIISGAMLSATIGYSPTVGDEIVLINNDSSEAIVGEFSGLVDDSTVTIDGFDFSVDYQGGDGNDLVLTALPTTFVWDGGDVDDDNWSSPDNWVGDISPVAGHLLEFPDGASRLVNINDFAADTVFQSILFTGADYTLAGNRIELVGGLDNQSSGTNTLTLDISLAASQTFQTDGDLNVQGEFELSTYTLTLHDATNPGVLGISGIISGSGGIIKTGSVSRARLFAANTYTGPTQLVEGTLDIYDATSLGTDVGGTSVAPGATLALNDVVTAERIALNAATITGSGTLTAGVTLDSNDATLLTQSNHTLTIVGISDGGNGYRLNLRPFGAASTLVLEGAADWSGETVVSGDGMLSVAAADALPDTGQVTFSSGNFTMLLNGFDETIGSLAGSAGELELLGQELIVGGDGTNSTFGGAITGDGGVIKTGIGTLELSGANANTGTTQVDAGVLQISGSLAAGNMVIVNDTGTLAGSGTVAGSVEVNSGGRVSPGASAGVLNTGNIIFQGSLASIVFEINGAIAGVDYDQLNVTGEVDLAGGRLILSGSYVPQSSDQFLLIDNDGSDDVLGTFDGLPEGTLVDIHGQLRKISYIGGDGNDVALSTPPEITGVKFHDLDANGVQDPGEPGLSGWTIYVDLNDNGEFDLGEPSDVTATDGSYRIIDPPTGTQKVREVVQSGWQQSSPTPIAGTLAEPNPPILPRTGIANTIISNDITANRVWTKAAGPYLVTGQISVAAGVTLTVEPGVEVLFEAGARISLTGELSAVGTELEPILFTSSAVIPAKGDWSGIDIQNTSGGHATLAFVTVEYASTAITVRCCGAQSPALVVDSVFRYNTIGFGSYSGAKVFIERTVFDGNTWAVSSADKDIKDSLFINNDYGIYEGDRTNVVTSVFRNNGTAIYGDYSTVVSYSQITGNTIGVDSYYNAGPKLFNNEISGNEIGAIFNDGSQLQVAQFNSFHDNTTLNVRALGKASKDLRLNYWGATTNAAIDATIDDAHDDANLALVLYEQILTAPPVTAPELSGALSVLVVVGEIAADVNFGNYQLGTISGLTFDDLDGNGSQDGGDLGLAGWTIYIDANDNGQLDIDERRTDSTSGGAYAFSDVVPGTYRLREVNKSGWANTAPAAGYVDVVIASGNTSANNLFGNHEPGRPDPVEIHGVKFNDVNANGIQDVGESGLVGWTIYLDLNGNRKKDSGEPSTATTADGSYSFTNLVPGTYVVSEVAQSGWQQSLPEPQTPLPPVAPPTVVIDHATIDPATTVGGSIFEDTTWSPGDSPIRVTDNIKVFQGATLTIEPGVVVLFDPGTKIEVLGTLLVEGTAASPILLTSSSATPAMGDWNGLFVNNTVGGSAKLAFATLEYASSAIGISNNKSLAMDIADSTFRYNILAIIHSSVTRYTIARSLFADNATAIYAGDMDIYDSIFINNTTGLNNSFRMTVENGWFENNDVAINGYGDTVVRYSTITANGTGVTSGGYSGPQLQYNDIVGNDIGIQLNASFSSPIATNNIYDNTLNNIENLTSSGRTATGNYWGTQSASAIASTIYDGADNPSLGVVAFDPFALQPIDTNPAPIGSHLLTLNSRDIASGVDFGNQFLPQVTMSSASQSVAEGSGLVTITAELDQAVAFIVAVPLLNLGGTALPVQDYDLLASAFTFLPGETAASVTLDLYDDLAYEGTETLTLALDPNGGARLGAITEHAITILDDDLPPEASFQSSSQIVSEDAGGAIVQVRLSAPSALPVTVPLTFAGSATLNDDYILDNLGTIIIQPGQLIGETIIHLDDDVVAESTELILVGFGSPTNATISTASNAALTHVVSIPQNDAPSVSFVIGGQSQPENAGTILVEVRLSNPSAATVTVPFSIGGNADGADRTISASPVEFTPGQTSEFISVNIAGDSEDELNETVQFDLGAPTNAVAGVVRRHILTIVDDDTALLKFTTVSQSVWEDAGTATVTVSLTTPSAVPVPFRLYVSGGYYSGYADQAADFSVSGIAGDNYIPGSISSGSQNFVITINNDTNTESSEIIVLGLADGSGGSSNVSNQSRHTITIKDDDPWVRITSTQGSFSEGNVSVPFTISLSAPTNKTVVVPYFTANGTARSPGDYTAVNASVTFLPGQTTANRTFNIKEDSIDEVNETVHVSLGNPSNAKLTSQPFQTFVITDDDAAPSVSFSTSSTTISEKNATKTITIKLSKVSTKNVYVTLGFSGTAKRNTDYTVSGLDSSLRLKISAGKSSASFTIKTKNDSSYQGNLPIIVAMKSASSASLPSSSSSRKRTFTIIDDERKPVPPAPKPPPTGTLIVSNGPSKTGSVPPLGIPDFSNSSSLAKSGNFVLSSGSYGYVEGSIAFLDANFNGVLDFLDLNGDGIQDEDEPDELYTVTELDGSFGILIDPQFDLNEDGVITAEEGRWVIVGGVDVSTGLEPRVPLAAPIDFFAVTPLSTLVENLVRLQGYDAVGAEERLLESFHLEGILLPQLNLLRSIEAGDENAASAYAASVKTSNTILQLADLFVGSPLAPPLTYVSETIYQNLAARIAELGSTLDLSSEAVVGDIIAGVTATTGIDLDVTVIDGAAAIVAAGNQRIDAIEKTGDLAYAAEVTKVKKVMHGEAAPALGTATPATIASLVSEYTGASLDAKISAATIGVLVPPSVEVFHAVTTEGDSGQVFLDFVVRLSGTYTSPVTVSYETADDLALAEDGDYAVQSGTLLWNPGDDAEQHVLVAVNGDTNFEADESLILALTTATNAVIDRQVGYGWILNDDSLSQSLPSIGGNAVLEIDSEQFGWLLNDALVADGFLTNPLTATLVGEGDVDDTLILNFTADHIRSDTINFQGGNGLGADSVQVRGGNFASITQTLSNADSGVTAFTSLENETVTLNWSELEPFLIDVGSVIDFVLQMPAGAVDAVLEDADPSDTTNPGMMQLRSPGGFFETTIFVNPTGSLTVRGHDGDDTLTIGTLDPSFSGDLHVAPQISVDQPSVSIHVGQLAMNGGTFHDPDGGTVELTASLGQVEDNGDGTWSWSYESTGSPATTTMVVITASDDDNGEAETSFALTVAPALVGDYNGDFAVNAADYTVWRNALGQTGLTQFSGADGDGDGAITQADYNVWKSHFGEVITPGAGSVALAEIAAEQPPATGSGTAAFTFIEPAIQVDIAVEHTPAETTSTPVELEAENTRVAALTMLDSRFTRHDSASRPRVRLNTFRVVGPAHDNLLLLLANDRVGRPSRQVISASNDRKDVDHREDDLYSQSLTDEPLAVALAEWR